METKHEPDLIPELYYAPYLEEALETARTQGFFAGLGVAIGSLIVWGLVGLALVEVV